MSSNAQVTSYAWVISRGDQSARRPSLERWADQGTGAAMPMPLEPPAQKMPFAFQ